MYSFNDASGKKVLVLLSASVEKFGVSRTLDFFSLPNLYVWLTEDPKKLHKILQKSIAWSYVMIKGLMFLKPSLYESQQCF